MYALIILVAVCVAVAIYLIFAQVLHLPSFKAARLLKPKSSAEKKSFIDDMALTVSYKLAPLIPMNAVKEVRYEKALKSAGLDITSKQYIANIIARQLLLFGLPTILLIFVNPLLGGIVGLLMVYLFFSQKRKIFTTGDTRKELINEELPKFTKYVINSFSTSPDMKGIVRLYMKNNAEKHTPLLEELNTTVADMEIYGIEKSLIKLKQRINSPLLLDLCDGLIAVNNGENVKAYLEDLVRKMQDVWEQNLKTKALKTEPKVMKLVYLVFGVAIVTLIVVMGGVLGSVGGSFAALM